VHCTLSAWSEKCAWYIELQSRWGGPGSKTVAGAKGATASIKRRIVPTIGALAEISSEGTQESSPHGQALRASVHEV
jgi:hypothetical protein